MDNVLLSSVTQDLCELFVIRTYLHVLHLRVSWVSRFYTLTHRHTLVRCMHVREGAVVEIVRGWRI